MKTVGAYEPKTHLSRLLEEVERGETIVITKHGSPVAMLTPAPKLKQIDVAAVISDLRSLRRELFLDGASLREMIEEGRRF